eukprot:7271866-Pyramimonas_sp.AAC.1
MALASCAVECCLRERCGKAGKPGCEDSFIFTVTDNRRPAGYPHYLTPKVAMTRHACGPA